MPAFVSCRPWLLQIQNAAAYSTQAKTFPSLASDSILQGWMVAGGLTAAEGGA